MSKVIVLEGLPACGKSTWAKEFLKTSGHTYKRINKDDLRAMIDDSVWSKNNEKFIIEVRDAMIRQALFNGLSVIVDDTNLHPKHVIAIRVIAAEYAADFEEKFFDVDVNECIRRNSLREGKARVGKDMIMRMYNEFLKPTPVELIQDISLPHAIIVDIDGTLAFANGRSHFDEKRVGEDLPNIPVIKLTQTLAMHTDIKVIVTSGRTEGCRTATMEWLDKQQIPVDRLFMRKIGDDRKDAIIKQELFDEYIRDKYYIDFVLDDRDQVVGLWRNTIGLTCLQVNYGNF